MSWVKLENRAPNRIDGVTIRVAKNAKGKGQRLFVRIARHVAQAGGLVLDKLSQVDLLLGEGPESGRMLVMAHQDGGFRCRGAKGFGAFTIYGVAPETFPQWPASTCVWEATKDAGVVLRLPWHEARAEPQETLPERMTASEIVECQRMEDAEYDALASRRAEAVGEVLFGGPAGGPMTDVSVDLQKPQFRVRDEQLQKAGLEGAMAEPPRPTPPHRNPKLVFSHGGKEVELDPKYYAVAMKLKAAIGKGFIPYDILIRASQVESLEYLTVVVSSLRKSLAPLGLDIGVQPKMGYFMRETEAAKTGAKGASKAAAK